MVNKHSFNISGFRLFSITNIILILITLAVILYVAHFKKYINPGAPAVKYKVIKTYPHHAGSFTEGLILDDGFLYESSGLYKKSSLRKSDLASGQMVSEYSLPPQYFAEGITIFGKDLYQLTYQEKTGFVYDKNTLSLKKIFYYATEGWGLTTDGKQLIMSDGTATLYYLDPQTFAVKRTLQVRDSGKLINKLNCLQYIDGKIYANVWPTDLIAIISAADGTIDGWINLKLLNPYTGSLDTDHVTNGIAYNKEDKTILVTGKNWPHIFAIQILH